MTHHDALPFLVGRSEDARSSRAVGRYDHVGNVRHVRHVRHASSGPGAPVPLAVLVADIAERVSRLSISRRDPEHFHIAKSDLAAELRALARRLDAGR